MSDPQVWLVTGASSGFGRAIAEAAAQAGDTVVAAVRRPSSLDELVAAYPGLIDPVELDVFGPAALVRAVLPGMRARGGGAIVQLSSMGGQIAFPGFSAYCATKFALEGYSEALAGEVAPFGVKVLVVEPGAFRTGFSGSGLVVEGDVPSEYTATVGATRDMITGIDGTQPGDPVKAAAAIRTALAAETTPVRLPLGSDAVDGVLGHLAAVREEVTAWEKVARGTDLDDS